MTHTGARYEGDVTERGENVIIVIRGVQTIVDRADVATISYTPSFDRQFQERVAQLEPNDVEARIQLARWCMQLEEYDAARDTLDVVLDLDPNNAEATELAAIVRGHIRLRAKQPADRAPPAPIVPIAPPALEPPVDTSESPVSRKLLSGEEIQQIRRAEWRPGDVVRVRVDTRVARKFAQDTNRPWREFGSRRAGAQAELMLREGTPEHRRGVQILSDPPVIAEFRRNVLPIVLSGCATSGCHGGINPKSSFALVTPADSEAAAYTNFYLLMTAAKELEAPGTGGIFGGGSQVRLIERGQGTQSLLFQYALPADVAVHDHPSVAQHTPLVQSASDPRARTILSWIDALPPMAPDYGFEFSPSTHIEGMTGEGDAEPATQPSR